MSDFPDWFGQPQFPRYGGVATDVDTDTFNSIAEQTLVDISGKGRIYGGFVLSRGPDAEHNDALYMYVDSDLLDYEQFYDLRKRNLVLGADNSFVLISYDRTTPWFCVNIKEGITFDSSFKITYRSANLVDKIVVHRIAYSLIE